MLFLKTMFQYLTLCKNRSTILVKWAAINTTLDEKQEILRLAKEFRQAVADKNSEMIIKIDAEFDGFATKIARNEFAQLLNNYKIREQKL